MSEKGDTVVSDDLYTTVVCAADAYEQACVLYKTLKRLRKAARKRGLRFALLDELAYDAKLDMHRLRRVLEAMTNGLQQEAVAEFPGEQASLAHAAQDLRRGSLIRSV